MKKEEAVPDNSVEMTQEQLDQAFNHYAKFMESVIAGAIVLNAPQVSSLLPNELKAAATAQALICYLSRMSARHKRPDMTTRQCVQAAIDIFFEKNGDAIDAAARKGLN